MKEMKKGGNDITTHMRHNNVQVVSTQPAVSKALGGRI